MALLSGFSLIFFTNHRPSGRGALFPQFSKRTPEIIWPSSVWALSSPWPNIRRSDNVLENRIFIGGRCENLDLVPLRRTRRKDMTKTSTEPEGEVWSGSF
jgi:hypothetical protein